MELKEERAVRLEHMSALQHQRLATESSDGRAVRLNNLEQNRNAHQKSHLALLERLSVHENMLKFHKEIYVIQTPTCSTCMEKCPGMNTISKTSEYQRCNHDKLIPQLYSNANNMSPGAIPSELQVSFM